MNKPKNSFPFKIILSYVLLATIAVVVSYFLYSEYQLYTTQQPQGEEEKIIETGALINLLYETDSFSRLALLSQEKEDFERYQDKANSLYGKIEEIRTLIESDLQREQLDSITSLLQRKDENIEQLRVLNLTRDENAALNDVLDEFRKLDDERGVLTVESFFKNPRLLSRREYKAVQDYVDYHNRNSGVRQDSTKNITIDSMMAAARFIVSEAKKKNSRMRRSLQAKENELIDNDLNISFRLRQIIAAFDAEINRNRLETNFRNEASKKRTAAILKWFGIAGIIVILLFSYIVITDFFKTERYKRKLQEEKAYSDDLLRSRDQLISTVSHDLKTPLNTIVGYSELFTHTPLSEKQKSYTRQIGSSAHFISRLVDDLLDFSKLEAGKLPIDYVPFSLESLIRKTAKASQDIHIDKDLALKVYIDESLRGKLFESDPLRLQQIVNNLVGNAFKFTHEGRIQIAAYLLEKNEDHYLVEIAVTDTGIGISEEKQQLIFKEFTQAEADTFQKFGGSGLGLAISKKLAQLLGGGLEVESVLGKGSTFYVTIPLRLSDKTTTQTEYTSLPADTALNAVIIDDDIAMITLLTELFEQMNITTRGYTRFSDFQEADDLPFDFVLTDIQMPEVSGFDVLQSLQEGKVNGFRNQPVIAMTGSTDYSRQQYLDRGFSEMLQKPFSKDQLLAALSPLFLTKIESDMVVMKKAQHHQKQTDIFDLSLLRSFLGTQEGLEQVCRVYFEQSDKDILQMEQAVAQNDLTLLKRTAHKMMTMTKQLQAQRVIPILYQLEHETAEVLTKEKQSELLVQLKAELETLRNALTEKVIR